MPTVTFTSALQRFLAAPSAEVEAATVGEALGRVFASNPALRGYVLDEHGAVRHHVAVFVDGTAIADKRNPTQALGERSEVYVMQALSGG